ncbi:hypothetical protein C5167_004434 [Papaver somniferum]|uniref:Uncharacterized protein n=1 Tax=Papaver somniferum TaxID=3469 RepID=A0A4Y7JBF7_PAPSO|nr:hypothetical protein C5167_004434 [Papaver somniferum]
MWVFSEADDKGVKFEDEEVERCGELLFCGGTSYCFCVSFHCVALDVEGRVYTWGKNKRGQLGHGDMINRDRPTIVSGLLGHKIIKAGAGRAHTVVVTDDGKSFAFGWNKHRQCGTGSTRTEFLQSLVSSQVSEVTYVVCGGDFTVWLSSVEGSSILTAGLPQYGQLGHGTDNMYNTKSASVQLAYEAQPCPKAIAAFAGSTVVKVACGTNHTVAVDSKGLVYTWGYGGYGRLGHYEQKDEWTPRAVNFFLRKVLPPNAIVAAGAHNSAVTAGGGQLCMWGKMKVTTGDDWMYPKPLLDLSGWNIRCMDSGASHNFVGAEQSCISWGHALNGQLGYGPEGPNVACGSVYSMVVVDRTNAGDKLDQLDVYEGKPFEEGTAEPKAESPAPKKTGAKASYKNTKKSKDSSESAEPKAKGPAPKEDGAKASSNKRKNSEEDDSDSGACENGSDDDENGNVEEKYRGGGSAGKSSGAKEPAAGKGTGRTRGRLPSAEKESTQLLVRNWWKERQAKKSHEEH